MTAPIPEDPLYIERIFGVNLIRAFEDMLLTYNIRPVFVHKVVRRQLVNGAHFVDGYYAFEDRFKLLFQIQDIINEQASSRENPKKRLDFHAKS